MPSGLNLMGATNKTIEISLFKFSVSALQSGGAKPKYKLTFLVCVLIFAVFGRGELRAQDQVTINNYSGNEIGLLVDGKLNGSYANDATYLSASSPALIGQFSTITGTRPNEIMAFSQDRPLAIYTPVPWTAGNDNVVVSFANKISIPVTIWVVYPDPDFASVSTKATTHALTTSGVYGTERVGVDFSTVTINDATANPLAPQYYNFTDYQSTMQDTIKRDIGYAPGQINIYYVRSIIFGGTYGNTQYTNAGLALRNGGPSVIVGSGTNNTILTHEIGHLLALWHVHTGAAAPLFDFTNVMSTNGSPNARFLTEGQVLRMHLSSNSVLNSTYNARPGLLIRDCDGQSTKVTTTCPGVQKRIWPDGTYPAN